jgi:carboxyl-terminal processing protease
MTNHLIFMTLVLASTILQAPQLRQARIESDLVESIDKNYLYAGEEPWKQLRPKLLKSTQGTAASLDGQLLSLHDGDLRIVTSEQMRAMQDETAGHESGIGLVDFAITLEPASGESRVVTALVDSPAFQSGLLPGDVIVSVDGRVTRGSRHEEVMSLLRGDHGTSRLTIRRSGKQFQIAVPKKSWDEPDVVFRPMKGKQKLGYLAIHLFTHESGNKVREAIASLAADGVDACIVDLRNNPGGYLDAMALAGSAFTNEVLGWKVRRDGTRDPIQSSSPVVKRMRLAILVNEGTASAAEILAEGLRDTVGATLLGEETSGRGQIQTFVTLGDGSGIIIPVANVQSAKGEQFKRMSGLIPDISIPSSANAGSADPAYLRAVELLRHG